MLFLLRKIRRKLLNSNKVTTYLLYAVGEIFLVVVGILIAVSIDNWNTEKNNTLSINAAIEFMMDDLAKDSASRESTLAMLSPLNVEIRNWHERINAPEATLDTIVNLMRYEYDGRWFTHFAENTTSYENMKSTGIFDLIPDTLRISVDEYYKNMYRSIKIIEIYNEQYRTPLEEYNRTYTIWKDTSSLITQTIWSNVDPHKFLPLARWLVFTKVILWNQSENFLKEDQERLIKLRQDLKHFSALNQ